MKLTGNFPFVSVHYNQSSLTDTAPSCNCFGLHGEKKKIWSPVLSGAKKNEMNIFIKCS